MLFGLEQGKVSEMKKLIVASNNNGKIKEIKEMLKDIDIKVVSLADEGIKIDVIEDGKSFEQNAKKKAQEICEYLLNNGKKDFVVMADDSGLEVDYLNGEPGINSARYSGVHGNGKENNEKLLRKLRGIDKENRKARFVCHLSVIDAEGKSREIEEYVYGYILEKEKGEDGFGYDPLFFYPELNKSFGEMSLDDKNKISHRALALIMFKDIIKEFI